MGELPSRTLNKMKKLILKQLSPEPDSATQPFSLVPLLKFPKTEKGKGNIPYTETPPFKKYQKIQLQEMRPVIAGEDLTEVSISEVDRKLKREFPNIFAQGYIAINPKDKTDKWYVSKDFFNDNYALVEHTDVPVPDCRNAAPLSETPKKMENKFTLEKLKQFLLTLTDEQLEQPVRIEFEDCPVQNLEGYEIVDETIFCNADDVGTLNELKKIHKNRLDITEYEIDKNKGDVIFY